jgi:hypothetical protein
LYICKTYKKENRYIKNMPFFHLHKNIKIFFLGVFGAFFIVGLFFFFFFSSLKEENSSLPLKEEEQEEEGEVQEDLLFVSEKIGESHEGRDIVSYRIGEGETHLFFIGGIHGGYEWNSVLLAYTAFDFFSSPLGKSFIPKNVMIHIIPVLNPDGLFLITQKEGRFSFDDVSKEREETIEGRFNSRGVDLNRNFACKWQKEAVWKGQAVSAGSAPFSEKEAVAFKEYVERFSPELVVFWHSKAGAVFASECLYGVLPKTREYMNVYAKSAGYTPIEEFSAYSVTGDSEGWLASLSIPALTVELETHTEIEWERNKKAILSLLSLFQIP